VQDKATLVIGNHLLEGKVATLPKPLAVLAQSRSGPALLSTNKPSMRKEQMDVDGSDEGGLDDEEDEGCGDDDNDVEGTVAPAQLVGWDVVAVVKRKIVFSKRPMPMTGSVVPQGRKVS